MDTVCDTGEHRALQGFTAQCMMTLQPGSFTFLADGNAPIWLRAFLLAKHMQIKENSHTVARLDHKLMSY